MSGDGEASLGALGKFRLLRELGRGGMGIVYLAEDQKLHRVLALKVLPKSVSSEERVVQRFVREAQAAARLRHPNIIPIFDAGEIDGTYYFSMEYVASVSLARILRALREGRAAHRGVLTIRRRERDGVLELELDYEAPGERDDSDVVLRFDRRNYVREALRLFVDVAEALHYAHERGVVHRDVKPSNLLLSSEGRLMVADFGLAKIGDARTITRTGDLLGSPSYMSPEQAMSRRAPVDRRTDIWSLGVTLYELLTLKHPFEAKSLEVGLRNILQNEPKSPRQFNPRLPKDIETVLLKALEKPPDRRYATAAELAEDLRCVLNYEAIHARSAGVLTRSVRFVRRHSVRVLVTVLVTLVLGLGVVLWRVSEERNRRDLELGIAYFQGVRESAPPQAFDSDLVQEVQDRLRERRAGSRDLASTIDGCVFEAIREAESALPADGEPGDLEAVWRALQKIRLFLLHNPNEAERRRMERFDRATADVRIRLVWALHDRLRGLGDAARPNLEEYERLLLLLGAEPAADPRLSERNPLVRRNALDAVCRLGALNGLRAASLDALASILDDDSAGQQVRADAIAALACLDRAQLRQDLLDRVARVVLADEAFELPALARFQAATLLAEAPRPERHRGALEHLALDPAAAVQTRARAAVSRLRTAADEAETRKG